MSGSDPSGISTDLRIARLRAIQRYWAERQEDRYNPYCYIPDLFNADPVAERPYSVPNNFIPEDVGGNIQVIDADDDTVLATETLNQMLSSFLPGGFQRRWGTFQIYSLNSDPSGIDRRIDITPGFTFDRSIPLSEVLEPGTREQYTPYQYPTQDVMLYIPQEMFVTPSDDDPSYWWDDENYVVWTSEPVGAAAANQHRLGQSDPTTNYLWFKHLDPDDVTTIDSTDIEDESSGFANRVGYCPDLTVLRCYYASLLTLYEKDQNQTFSRVIQYQHDEDQEHAFVTSEERSQALLFNFVRSRLRERIDIVLRENPGIYRNLQLARLFRDIWNDLFFAADDGLEHVFAVKPFFDVLTAIDYWYSVTQQGDQTLFDLSVNEVLDALPTVIPDTADNRIAGGRLHLAGQTESDRRRYRDLIESNREEIEQILTECGDRDKMAQFAEEVCVHSLTHALSTWAVQEAAGGAAFEMWYDVNFQSQNRNYAKAAIYDSVQGGAGIGKEMFDALKEGELQDLLPALTETTQCYTSEAEDVTISLLSNHQASYLHSVFDDSPEEIERLVADAYGTDPPVDVESVATMVRRQARSLFETRELARFYGEVASIVTTLEDELDRTPRTVDVILELEDHTFRDDRINTTYKQFANRTTRRRDLSEISERISELTKQCIYACPDCLKTDETDCIHGMRYQEQLLNKRLLRLVLGGER